MPDFPAQALSFSLPRPFSIKTSTGLIDLSQALVMGILNLSPDSFFAGSRLNDEKELLSTAERMLEEGAGILDIGAMSSRPGAKEISEQEEIQILTPGIRAIRKKFPKAILSTDVFRPNVAEAALSEGADIINDIRGSNAEEKLLSVVARHKAPYMLMHSRGIFADIHRANSYENIAVEIASELQQAISRAREAGITDVVVDPGFGFSKNPEQNFALLRELRYLEILDCPILIGISRKSMIYRALNCSPEESLNGRTALHMAALVQGVHILRVHDVKPAAETIRLFSKLCLQES